jgi:hypothetical protein
MQGTISVSDGGLKAFFERVDVDVFQATESTMSPWDRDLQHGGPATALLAWTIEQDHPRESTRIARIAVDFLGGIPRDICRIRTRVVRPGRRIELIEGILESRGRDAVIARVWRVATHEPGTVPHGISTPQLAPPLPPAEAEIDFGGWGYGAALEWRFVSGRGLAGVGPSDVWTRVRVPLVEGVPIRPIDRLLLAVDSANGISPELPFAEWLFVPPSLSVAVQRYPVGEWTFIRAQTTLSDDGVGVARAWLADRSGFLGVASQSLYVESRRGDPAD